MSFLELLGPLLLIGVCIYVYIKLRRILGPTDPPRKQSQEHHSSGFLDKFIFYFFLLTGLIVTAGGFALLAYQAYYLTTQGVVVDLKLYTLIPEKLFQTSTSPAVSGIIDFIANLPISFVCIALGVALVYLTWLSNRKTE